MNSWQHLLADVITSPAELCAELQLPLDFLADSHAAQQDFALRVPRGFVARMEKGNPTDPLLKQILPIGEEMVMLPGYSQDPLQEKSRNFLPGLLHKYHGRVLVLVAGGCAVHCRYCFRRHFAYAQNALDKKGWQAVFDYIAADETIQEVIYSGGDPLLIKDAQLAALTEKFAAISHVKRLRIHSRLPIVIPQRVTADLLHWLTDSRLQTVMVVHCNHANEIDEAVGEAMQRLRQAGVTVLNQAVLLKGVNDDAEALIALSERLFAVGVLPYYLNMLDAVQGAAHFAVSEARARRLMGQVCCALPGYLVPKLVQEDPHVRSKCLIEPEYFPSPLVGEEPAPYLIRGAKGG